MKALNKSTQEKTRDSRHKFVERKQQYKEIMDKENKE
jgi:hypothetical protein